jgi:phosphoribosylformylglycinamidine cyclo-ligase
VVPHYCANITGHGWRKLLRHPKALSYHVHTVAPVPAVLRFIQQHAGMSDSDAYGTLNMGAGFALFVAHGDLERTLAVAHETGFAATHAGHVQAGPKRLWIEPVQVGFDGADLQLR